MNVIKFDVLAESELLSRLKRTRLRGFDRAEVYKDSHLEIEDSFIHRLTPCQNYVLSSTVTDILNLYGAFQSLGIDIFHLRGGLLFWLEGSNPEVDPPIPLLPPIVEKSESDGGIWIINDGMHRVYAASQVGERVNTVLVSQVPLEYPYYAYPLPGGWSDVQSVLERPESRKAYRNPDDYKALFRDFNEIFEGVQKQRTDTSK